MNLNNCKKAQMITDGCDGELEEGVRGLGAGLFAVERDCRLTTA
jgi:hypothetical protein